MSKESSDIKATFLGHELSEVVGGYKGGKKIYTDFMEEEGILPDTIEKVLTAQEKLYGKMSDFTSEKVQEKQEDVGLTIAAGVGIVVEAHTTLRTEKAGFRPEGTPDDVEVPKTVKFGSTSIGMKWKLGKDWKSQKEKIASDVEASWKKANQ